MSCVLYPASPAGVCNDTPVPVSILAQASACSVIAVLHGLSTACHPRPTRRPPSPRTAYPSRPYPYISASAPRPAPPYSNPQGPSRPPTFLHVDRPPATPGCFRLLVFSPEGSLPSHRLPCDSVRWAKLQSKARRAMNEDEWRALGVYVCIMRARLFSKMRKNVGIMYKILERGMSGPLRAPHSHTGPDRPRLASPRHPPAPTCAPATNYNTTA